MDCYCAPYLERGRNVCLSKILTLEQERFAGDLGKRIGKAVAEVEGGAVAAFAEAAEGIDGDQDMLRSQRSDVRITKNIGDAL